jgi:hypothetical protein
MDQVCVRCDEPFDSGVKRGYCDDCLSLFRERQVNRKRLQTPSPGVHCTGRFLDPKECPVTVENETGDGNCCGLCGSESLYSGYGFAGGYGLGGYTFCLECDSVLDFCEDME